MIRRAFTVASAISLMLCLATCVLWARSNSNVDMALYTVDTWKESFTAFDADSALGVITIGTAHYDDLDSTIRRYGSHGRWVLQTAPIATLSERISLQRRFVNFSGWHSQRYGYGYELRSVQQYRMAVPHWSVAILTLVLPVFRIRHSLRLRRAKANGLCRRCGYDLRATPDRCPECGTPVSSSRRTPA